MELSTIEVLWDVFWTIFEIGSICFLGRVFARKKVNWGHDILFIVLLTAITEIFTFFNIHTFIKAPLLLAFGALGLKLIYRMGFFTGCMVNCCIAIALCISELNTTAIMNLLNLPWMSGSESMLYFQMYLYVPAHIFAALLILFQRKILLNLKNMLSPKLEGGITVILLVGIILTLVLSMNMAYLNGIYAVMAALGGLVIVVALFLGMNFFARSLRTQFEKEQKELQLKELQAKYQYYDCRLKEEERIRAIYHDMKNHLLVLEGSQSTEETRQMA